MKSSLLALSLLVLIMVAILFYSAYAVGNGSSSRKHPKCTQLWVYTEPVQKGPCVIFHHISGYEFEKLNRATDDFNKGVEAGHLRTLTFNSTNQLNCPSGNTKEFCSGWKSATQFILEQYKAGLTSRGVLNNPSWNPSNSTDGGKCIGDNCQVQTQNRSNIEGR